MWGISWLGSVSRGCGVSPGWDLSVGDVGVSPGLGSVIRGFGHLLVRICQ